MRTTAHDNRHRSSRHSRHHRSARTHHHNQHNNSNLATSQNIRSFFSSSRRRRTSASLLSTAAPLNHGRRSMNNHAPPASAANHHVTGASTSLNFLYNNIKKRERNLLSACCAVFTIAILSVSLVETRWFYLSGGGCNVNYIGVAHFFAPGRLESQREMSKVIKSEITIYNFVLPNGIGEFRRFY